MFKLFFFLLISAGYAADLDVIFTHKESSNRSNYWRGRHNLPNFPAVSDQDLLAFNVVRITTSKVSFENEEPKENFDEVSTGFLTWSNYNTQSQVVKEYYGVKNEPLLITCKHCVKEWPKAEEIQLFSLDMHYVDPDKQKFYLLTIRLSNISKKIPWILGDRDIAALQLGDILQQGKAYMDHQLSSSHYPFFNAIDYKPIDTSVYSIGYLSDVTMFGYPYELSASNSMPLARFGHCSTDPKQSMWEDLENGTADFYVDMASISGSSGSPIWFHFREFTGKLCDPKVCIEDTYVNDDTVEQDGDSFKLIDKDIDLGDAYVEDEGVEIEESKSFKFAGMLFGGPEQADGSTHDIHLGQVLNAGNIFEFITTINH